MDNAPVHFSVTQPSNRVGFMHQTISDSLEKDCKKWLSSVNRMSEWNSILSKAVQSESHLMGRHLDIIWKETAYPYITNQDKSLSSRLDTLYAFLQRETLLKNMDNQSQEQLWDIAYSIFVDEMLFFDNTDDYIQEHMCRIWLRLNQCFKDSHLLAPNAETVIALENYGVAYILRASEQNRSLIMASIVANKLLNVSRDNPFCKSVALQFQKIFACSEWENTQEDIIFCDERILAIRDVLGDRCDDSKYSLVNKLQFQWDHLSDCMKQDDGRSIDECKKLLANIIQKSLLDDNETKFLLKCVCQYWEAMRSPLNRYWQAV